MPTTFEKTDTTTVDAMIVARDMPQDLLDLLNIVDYGRIPQGQMGMIIQGLRVFVKGLPQKDRSTKNVDPSDKAVARDVPQKLLNVFNRISYRDVPQQQYHGLFSRLETFVYSGNVPLQE